jgi:hypothetical protein
MGGAAHGDGPRADRFAQPDLPSTNGNGIATVSDWSTSVLVRELIPASLQ